MYMWLDINVTVTSKKRSGREVGESHLLASAKFDFATRKNNARN